MKNKKTWSECCMELKLLWNECLNSILRTKKKETLTNKFKKPNTLTFLKEEYQEKTNNGEEISYDDIHILHRALFNSKINCECFTEMIIDMFDWSYGIKLDKKQASGLVNYMANKLFEDVDIDDIDFDYINKRMKGEKE